MKNDVAKRKDMTHSFTDNDVHQLVKGYFTIAIWWVVGFAILFALINMFVYATLKQDEMQKANDCDFTYGIRGVEQANDWYLKNCNN